MPIGHTQRLVVTANSPPRWNDVLENGSSSPFAQYFDLDWNPPKPELMDKVMIFPSDNLFFSANSRKEGYTQIKTMKKGAHVQLQAAERGIPGRID